MPQQQEHGQGYRSPDLPPQHGVLGNISRYFDGWKADDD